MRIFALLTFILLVAPGASPLMAQPQTYNVPGPEGTTVDVPLECPPAGSLVFQGRLYVACGACGVTVFDLAAEGPALVSQHRFEGEVVGLTLVGEAPWALVRTLSARPLTPIALSETAPAPLNAPGAAAAEQAPRAPVSPTPGGQIVKVGPGYAILDKGLEDGFQAGDWVKLLTRVQVQGADMGMADDQTIYREIEAGRGRIEVVGGSQSRVELLRGSQASGGDRFERLEQAPKTVRFAPERLGGIREVTAVLRPFLAIENLGVGTINELAFSYFGKQPYFVEARLQPFTAGWSRDGNLISVSAMGSGGYDNRFFGIGLGLGFTASNAGITDIGVAYASADMSEGGYSGSFEDVRQGFSLGQVARLGSRDGLHLEVRNTFVMATVEQYTGGETYWDDEAGDYVYEQPTKTGEYKEFRWGATRGRLVIPVALVTDLHIEVGGGSAGYFNIEGGVQTWIRGNGDAGSWGISVAAGYGYMSGHLEDTSVDILGPLVSLGLRRRF